MENLFCRSYKPCSNVVTYGTTAPPTQAPTGIPTTAANADQWTLVIAGDGTVSRTGSLGESLTWVIKKDGVIVLERNAANELSYKYFDMGTSFIEINLKTFSGG